MVLIGEHDNNYVVKALQTSFNPFEFDFFQNKTLPKINLGFFKFEPKFNEEIFDESGYFL